MYLRKKMFILVTSMMMYSNYAQANSAKQNQVFIKSLVQKLNISASCSFDKSLVENAISNALVEIHSKEKTAEENKVVTFSINCLDFDKLIDKLAEKKEANPFEIIVDSTLDKPNVLTFLSEKFVNYLETTEIPDLQKKPSQKKNYSVH